MSKSLERQVDSASSVRDGSARSSSTTCADTTFIPEVIVQAWRSRLAQRTPSAGFSQGQRLVVITVRERRREVARIFGEAEYEPVFGPWISECAAQFIPCVSEAIYHRRYREPDKIRADGTEIEWPIPYWWVGVGATMQNVMLAAVNEGLGCGFVGRSTSLKRGWIPFESFVHWNGWQG